MTELPVLTRPEVIEKLKLMQPFAFSVRGASEVTGLSRSTFYEEIKKGNIKARRYRDKIVLLPDDVKEFLENLPKYNIKTKQ